MDTRVAIAVIAIYFALSASLLPASEYPRALGLAAVVFAAVAAWAHRLGRRPLLPLSVFS